MKKIVGMIAAAALAATAFAEINIGSWNRAVFVPFAYDGDTVRTLEGVSWSGTNYGGAGVRTGLSFSASTENAGFVMDLHNNPDNYGSSSSTGIGLGDNGYVWVKPIEMFRVAFGKIDNNWGRLDHCFGTWDLWRFGNDLSVGEEFAGVGRQKGTGADFTLTPVEGLTIDYQANFYGGNDDEKSDLYKNDDGDDTVFAGNARAYEVFWEAASLAVGYQADFGFIRAIVNGQRAGYNKDGDSVVAAKISVAADITAVENMTFKVGATIPTNLTGYNADGSMNSVKFGACADFAFDPLTLHAQAEFAINPKEIDTDNSVKLGDLGFRLGAGVDFNINDAFAAVADFRFGKNKYMGESSDALGIYAGLKQKLTNATFDFGVMMGKNVGPSVSPEKDEPFTFAVPLTITASF